MPEYTGNLSRWILTERGWRMHALTLYVPCEAARKRSLEERNVIVWHPDTQPHMLCFFYGGEELFTSEVLMLEELEREIVRLRGRSVPDALEGVAQGVLLESAIINRDAFLNRIMARGSFEGK